MPNTLADAKAFFGSGVSVPDGEVIFVAGRTTPGDGYQGTFRYRSGDTTTAYSYDAFGFVDNQGRRFERVLAGFVYLNWTGADISLGSDASAQLRFVIDSAVSRGLQTVYFTGQFKLTSQVYNREPHPNVFLKGLGERTSTVTPPSGNDQCVLQYTGTNICFNFSEANSSTEVRGPSFENITFHCTQGAGGMFSFNYYDQAGNDYVPVDHPPNTTPGYVSGVTFRNCFAIGARAGSGQTGDFIRAKKVAQLFIDNQCAWINWRRGIFGKGIENATIQGRALGNTRHIHLESSGTFGNRARVDVRFLGPTGAGAADSETRYAIYDNAHNTKIIQPDLEDNNGAAFIYFNGIACSVIEPTLSNDIAPWRLGPNAKSTIVYRPQGVNGVYSIAPVYDASESLDSGNGRIQVVVPSADFMAALLPHPRQHVIAPETNYAIQTEYSAGKLLIDSNGCRQQRYDINVLDFNAQTTSAGFTDPVVTADSTAPSGYAIKLLGTGASGFLKRFQLGRHAMPGDVVQWTVWIRGTTSSGWASRMSIVNDAGASIAYADPAYSNTYARYTMSATLSGAIGDTFGVRLWNSGGTADIYFGGGTVEIVSVDVADVTLGSVGNVNGAASVTDVNARLGTIQADLAAIKAILRSGKKMSG